MNYRLFLQTIAFLIHLKRETPPTEAHIKELTDHECGTLSMIQGDRRRSAGGHGGLEDTGFRNKTSKDTKMDGHKEKVGA